MVPRTRRTRTVGVLAALALGVGSAFVNPRTASAGTVDYFSDAFDGHYVPDDFVVVPPGRYGQPNTACLSDEGAFSNVLERCPTSIATYPWDGKLRLTDFKNNQLGGVFLSQTVPGDQLLVSTFDSYQHGSAASPADGLAFVLAAVDPAKKQPPTALGSAGGSLGYSATKGTSGLPNGYLGFGLDVYGGFSRTGNQGTGCPDAPYVSASTAVPGQAVVRGPGNKTVGYCALNSTATSAQSAPVALHSTSLQGSEVPVEVAINPTTRATTTDAGTAVAARSYAMTFTPVGGSPRTLRGALPKVQAGLYPDGWVDADGYPRQLAYGVVGTTGGSRDFHEISDMRAYRASAPPTLSVTQTAYLDEDPAAGDVVSYVERVGTGLTNYMELLQADVRAVVTLPDGVQAIGGSGIGWDCTASGRQVDCRQDPRLSSSRSALASKLVVQGQASRAGVTRTAIAAGTRVELSAPGADPVSSDETVLAAVPPPSADVAVDPASGPAGSWTSLTGTRLDQVSLVRVGTPAELAAGTAAVIVPCIGSSDSRECFSVAPQVRSLSLTLPAHRPGPVQVQAVSLGSTASASFTYVNTPDAPAVVVRRLKGALQVDWYPGPDGGSPITGWTFTAYKNGVKQTSVEYDEKTTTYPVPGVRVGETYRFTVVAHNANGAGRVGSEEVTVY